MWQGRRRFGSDSWKLAGYLIVFPSFSTTVVMLKCCDKTEIFPFSWLSTSSEKQPKKITDLALSCESTLVRHVVVGKLK